MTATVYECIYCDFTTEDEQDYNHHMFDHQEAEEPTWPALEWPEDFEPPKPSWRNPGDEQPEDPAMPEIPFMWDGRIVQ